MTVRPERKSTLVAGQRIGLLGGSFNPAHEGHVHLSTEAIKRLKLDTVWWLVSPQNPLKKKDDMAPYHERVAFAETITAPYDAIQISEFEAERGLQYSYETVTTLQQSFPSTEFVWLMGADNLQIFHKWKQWQSFFETIPIAVFDRAPFSHSALRQVASLRYAKQRIDNSDAALLGSLTAPAWVYCFMQRNTQSSTEIRKTLGSEAFLRHNERVDKVDGG